MTPHQISRAAEGYQLKEKARWERALRISGHLGDKLTAEKLFSGASQGRMNEERYNQLKARLGYTSSAQ